MNLWREAYDRGEPWALAAWKAWTTAPLILLVVGGCSGEYTRERGNIATDLHKYCLDYPKDSACQKDK